MVDAESPVSKTLLEIWQLKFRVYAISTIIHALTDRFHRDEIILMLSSSVCGLSFTILSNGPCKN